MTNKIQQNFFKKLEKIYRDMDTAWENTASAYGFKCKGCTENCCETEFYHYTHIEKDYLLHGVQTLDKETLERVIDSAEKVNTIRNSAKRKNKHTRIMCPLNHNNLCIIYKFRPMICRLHGIPHQLARPGSEPVMSPGCGTGSKIFNKKGYIKFDRTPFYADMAAIEINYRKATGKTKKIKQTIAHMLVS